MPDVRSVSRTFAIPASALLALTLSACVRRGPDVASVIRSATREELVPFSSESDLRHYLGQLADARRAQIRAQAAAAEGEEADAEDTGGAPSGAAGGESITNTQEAGVDEGGIVKVHGDHLVVLRRGRLFTVALGQSSLTPISAIGVNAPNGQPADWYDEMLIHDDTIIVVGYSYRLQATELGFFDIDARGGLRHRATHHLRSNDYYSSRNYASRLIGDTLIFYMPYFVLTDGQGQDAVSLPGIATQNGQNAPPRWRSILEASEVYRPIQPTPYPVLHTVVSCDLSSREPRCRARGVLGPYGRTFYVSPTAVYVWVTSGQLDGFAVDGTNHDQSQQTSVVYRLPLDGSTPGALRTWGVPTDQFSLQERDGYLNALLRAEGGGDMMWGPEVTQGDVALMRVPVEGITAAVGVARPSAFRRLPRPSRGYEMQNRFVGDRVLYGTGSGWGEPSESDRRVFVHDVVRGGNTEGLALEHGVDRIEPMGHDAVVVGTDGRNLHFTSIELDDGPSIASSFMQRNAAQGETRSHGFFFRSEGDEDGTLGLPIRGGGEPGVAQLVEGSAGVVFLRVSDLRLSPVGVLASRSRSDADDACTTSCADWYGNARPIFSRGRVFALLGYELVEGELDGQGIRELRRADMITVLRAQAASAAH